MANDPRTNSENSADSMKHKAEGMGEQARSMASDARDRASDLAGQAREEAMHRASQAREEVERRANEGVHYGADQVSSTAHALRRAADDVDGTFQGQLLHQAAEGLTELSDGMRGKSIGELAGDLAAFGRRNPVAFLGGAALTGFAIARFARASRPRRSDYEGHYGDSYGRTSQYGADDSRTGMNQPMPPGTADTPTGAAPAAGATTGPLGPTGTNTPATPPGSNADNKGKHDV